MDDDEDEGGAKVQTKRHHTWLIPQTVLYVVLGISISLFFFGIVLMAIGGGGNIAVLSILGGIMFGFGIFGMILCLLVCLYAYFVFGTKDQAMQTETEGQTTDVTDLPEYATIGRRSALKSNDSTLRKNGTLGQKKVTMAPDVGPNSQNLSTAVHGGNTASMANSHQTQAQVSPSNATSKGKSRFYAGDGSSATLSRLNSNSSDVGTGGIRILPADPPFPTVAETTYQASTPSVVYSRGGSSASSVVDSFVYPPTDHHSIGHDSGYTDTSQRSLRNVSISPAPSGSESQYSTLRSIPVTHIISESQMQQMKQQQQSTDVKQPMPVSPKIVNVEVNSQARVSANQKAPNAKGYRQQVLSADLQDFDYDIPEDRTSLISHKSGQSGQSSVNSYHEQQMNYQRQKRQQELQASRQNSTTSTNSLRRDDNPGRYGYQEQHQQHEHYQHQSQSQRMPQASSSYVTVQENQIPENQPLVHQGVRRPMTFEQISSSKMSMYDNNFGPHGDTKQ